MRLTGIRRGHRFGRGLLFLLGFVAVLGLVCAPDRLQAQEGLRWKVGAEAAAIERRIEALLARMTLEEKVGQTNLTGRGDQFRPEWVATGRSGAVMNFLAPTEIRPLQEAAKASRLGIPLIIGLDAIHGYATYFPQPLGQAATFNPELMELSAYWTAREARAVGVNWTFAPMVDVSRDPRWGRVMEGAGEDPYLSAVASVARVRGYHRGGVATSLKHFIGYGEVEGGRDYANALIPRSRLYDVHVPPFAEGVKAGAFTVMTSLSAMNGVPSTGDRSMITDLLKSRLGFRGFVVSDFESIMEMLAHRVAADPAGATRLAMRAGVDMDMFAGFYDRHLAAEVRAGRIPMAAVDDAVRRILRVKFHMGLFDEAPVDPETARAKLITPEARAASLRVAREAMVLLTNNGVLPIRREVKSIAVIGALGIADDDWQYADNASLPRIQRTTLPRELSRHLGSEVTIVGERAFKDSCGLAYGDREAALKAAREAELIVTVMGEECEQIGEGTSRTRLDLSPVQAEMLEDLIATGKPVVLILKTARPFVLTSYVNRVAAIIQSFHLGSDGRVALGEVLTGITNPSGKLPMTFPRSVGQIPISVDMLPTGRPRLKNARYETGYLDESIEPLFPFGFGLSYSPFEVSDIKLDAPSVRLPNGIINGSVRLTNRGERAGKEVVQIYMRQRVGSRSRPSRQFVAFEKVMLAPGEAREVRFSVPARALTFHDDDGKALLEAGDYDVFVGTDARASLTTSVRFLAAR